MANRGKLSPDDNGGQGLLITSRHPALRPEPLLQRPVAAHINSECTDCILPYDTTCIYVVYTYDQQAHTRYEVLQFSTIEIMWSSVELL